MRKVMVSFQVTKKAVDHPGDDISFDEQLCIFHQFVPRSTGCGVDAIVEDYEGRIHSVSASGIRFEEPLLWGK